jgi:uncharacterized protein (TIGR00266 family)
MQIKLKHQPSYALATAELGPNEKIKVEPGSMVAMSGGVQIETKAEGGLLGGLKRVVTGESFFQNTYTAPASGGEVLLAPAVPGDLGLIAVQPGRDFLLQSGAYVACEMGLTMDTKWGGARGFFGSGTLLLLRVSGTGQVLMASYGALEVRDLTPGQRYVVDTGHIVGFDASVQFQVQRVGGWKSTILSGEGLVVQLTGPGRVFMQTRSDESFVNWLVPRLPSRSN